MPQISVIVPVYKVEPYLRRCVDSILGQTFTDFELILVDDGSPDGCPAICDEYARQDDRVLVIHQENGGLSAARNAGIDWAFANSDSQWLTFIDSDDWVHPQYLELLHKAVIHCEVRISMCCLKKTDTYEIENITSMPHISKIIPECAYISPNRVGIVAYACGRLFQKQLFSDIRFPHRKLWEDIFTIPRLLFKTTHIAVVHDNLYYYFMNPGSILHIAWKPSRVDLIEAYEYNMHFLKDVVSNEAYLSIARGYINSIYGECRSMKAGNFHKQYPQIYALLVSKLKIALKTYSKQCGYTIFTHPWFYQICYPKTTWLCTKIALLDSIIRKVIGKTRM